MTPAPPPDQVQVHFTPSQYRGLAPPARAKKFEALPEQFPPFRRAQDPGHADVGEGQRLARRDVSYACDFYTTFTCTSKPTIGSTIMSQGRRRLVQRFLLPELVGEGVSYEQYSENLIFVECRKRFGARERRRLLASLINFLVLPVQSRRIQREDRVLLV